MKARIALFLFVTLLFLWTIGVRAQGHGCVSFANGILTDATRIFVFDATTGASAPAAGPNYKIALYWAPQGTTDESLFVQAGDPGQFLTGSFSGGFIGGSRTIQTTTDGPVLAFQCRAWAVAYGDSYQTAFASGIGFGKGPIFEVDTAVPLIELYPRIGAAPGFRGFAIVVPEPRIVSLASFCFVAAFLFRRKRWQG